MASLIENLIEVLEAENEVYQELLPIAMNKTQIIVKNDTAALQEITDQEQKRVDVITSLELRREGIMVDIRTVIGGKAPSLNLTTLIQLLDKQPKEQKELSRLRDGLHETIHKITEINNRNAMLIQQSLEMIEFNMNYIQSIRTMPGNNTYTKGASARDGGAVQTGMFDAKQ